MTRSNPQLVGLAPASSSSAGSSNSGPHNPGGGLFIRHRNNAISVRMRRRKGGHSSTHHVNNAGDDDDDEMMRRSRLEDDQWTQRATKVSASRPRAYSEDWDVASEEEDDDEGDDEHYTLGNQEMALRRSLYYSRHRQQLLKASPMETLDRRISLSTDQLDTLRRQKKHAHFQDDDVPHSPDRAGEQHHRRLPRARSASRHGGARSPSAPNEEVEFQFRGEKMSKSRYFFGENNNHNNTSSNIIRSSRGRGLKSRWLSSSTGNNSGSHSAGGGGGGKRRSASDLLLKDDGPYSRRLYGPPPDQDQLTQSAAKIDEERRKRAKSQEYLMRESLDDLVHPVSDPSSVVCPPAQKKGLLWQQRDKLFSRWKERYFILSKEYFHCFKKGSSRLTEMGGFIFKVKLLDVESVDLLDKRGYLTICLSLIKDGKIYLRRPEGIKEWYNMLQGNIYESKRRRKFWVPQQRQVTDSTGIEQWLLSRQKIGTAGMASGYPGGGGGPSAPGMALNSSSSSSSQAEASDEAAVVTASAAPNPSKKHAGLHAVSGGGGVVSFNPRPVISRSQIVDRNNNNNGASGSSSSGLKVDKAGAAPPSPKAATKALGKVKIAEVDKQPPQPQSQQQQPQQQQQQLLPQQPRGINRLSLVNELILKEQMTSVAGCTGDEADEDSSSAMAQTSSEASGTTSSSSSSTSTCPSVKLVSVVPTTVSVGGPANRKDPRPRPPQLDDSGNDSGHNSMNTGSDTHSDNNSSSSEDHSHRIKVPSPPSVVQAKVLPNSGHVNNPGPNVTSSSQLVAVAPPKAPTLATKMTDCEVLSSDLG